MRISDWSSDVCSSDLIFYTRRPEMETAEEKLTWLSQSRLRELESEEIQPDEKGYWLNLSNNDFERFMPVATKGDKAGGRGERSIFKLLSLGFVTARDEWVFKSAEGSVGERCVRMWRSRGSPTT